MFFAGGGDEGCAYGVGEGVSWGRVFFFGFGLVLVWAGCLGVWVGGLRVCYGREDEESCKYCGR